MGNTFEEIRKRAQRPEDTVPVCLAGNLVAEHEQLEEQLAALRDDPNAGIEGNGAGEVAEKIRDLEQRMKADTYPFRLRALPRKKFKAMISAHPPRRLDDGSIDERDAARGFNIDALYEELVPASIVDPEPGPSLNELIEEQLTDGQFIQLGNLAFFLNRGEVQVPFSRAASAILRSTGGD